MTGSQRWAFAPHVHAAVDAGNLVLLDIAADAYFCLPGLGEGFRPGPLADGADRLPPTLLGELARAHLVRRTSAQAPTFDMTPPSRDLAAATLAPVGLRDACDLAAAWCALAPRYYRRPFGEVIDLVRAGRGRLRGGDPAAVEARAARFNTLLPWSPIQGACLLQAAWLIAFLHRAGLTADWVFGVRTWPFSAHCWVQCGPVVLNDTVERVAPYRVILKV